MKTPLTSGTRNGFIAFGAQSEQVNAGVLIGALQYMIGGTLVAEVKETQKFDQNKVFDLDITVDFQKKTIVLKVDGKEVKTKITKVPPSIKYVGYMVGNSTTEFSDLQVSGD